MNSNKEHIIEQIAIDLYSDDYECDYKVAEHDWNSGNLTHAEKEDLIKRAKKLLIVVPSLVILSGDEEGLIEIRNPCLNCDYGCDTDEHRKTCIMYQEYNTKLALIKSQKALTERNCEAKHKAEIEKLLDITTGEARELITCFENESIRRYGKVNPTAPVLQKLQLFVLNNKTLEGLK